ncbi:hypothetical protein M3C63_06335 [Brevibacterium luteolum]|uniref:hypothetical protein n=1 Tax=Brevibacterium luteolum TaxID=199591 RepID=UPI00223BA787|nr:hypothetical protein [Brevibacterium luteolum]MCT1921474.1 hypothetical protein [Brevibacterium luteolum]
MAAPHHSAERQQTAKEKGRLARFFTQRPRHKSDFILIWATLTAVSFAITGIYAWMAPDTMAYLQDYGFLAVLGSVVLAGVLYAFYRDAQKENAVRRQRQAPTPADSPR